MKALILSLLLSQSAHALDLPANWCGPRQEPCSPQQIEIWEKFHSATQPLPQETAHFTGSCYIKSIYHDPARLAYGLAIFSQREGHTYYAGRVGEFYESNPWADLALDDALKMVRYEDRFQLSHYPSYADVNVSDSKDHFIFYWFRLSEDGQKLYSLNQADGSRLTFCELERK